MISYNYSDITEQDVCGSSNQTGHLPTEPCTSWNYDNVFYNETIVTEVSNEADNTSKLLCILTEECIF